MHNNSHLKRWGRQQQTLSQWIRARESIIQVGLCFGSIIVLQNHFYLNINSIAPKVLWAICWSPKMLVSLMRNVLIKLQQWLLWEFRNIKCLEVKAPRSEDLGTAKHGMSNTHSHECYRATQPTEAGISPMRKLAAVYGSIAAAVVNSQWLRECIWYDPVITGRKRKTSPNLLSPLVSDQK